jgi:hypothetical protein
VVLIRGLYKSPIGRSSDASVAGSGLRVLRSPGLFFKSRRLPERPMRLRRSIEGVPNAPKRRFQVVYNEREDDFRATFKISFC